MSWEPRFIYPNESLTLKHGNFHCVWCRKEGKKVKGMICTYRKSISWRRDTCSCDEHRSLAINKIKNEYDRDQCDYYTEADYQTWLCL